MAISPDEYDSSDMERFVLNFDVSYYGDLNLHELVAKFVDDEVTVSYTVAVREPWYCTQPQPWPVDISREEAEIINSALFDRKSLNEIEELKPVLERAKEEILDSEVFTGLEVGDPDEFRPEDYYIVTVVFDD